MTLTIKQRAALKGTKQHSSRNIGPKRGVYSAHKEHAAVGIIDWQLIKKLEDSISLALGMKLPLAFIVQILLDLAILSNAEDPNKHYLI